MVLKKSVIEKIKGIIEKHHASFLVGMLGHKVLTATQLRKLKEAGIDVSNKESFIENLYHHNYLNEHGSAEAPTSVQEMEAQQEDAIMPKEAEHDASREHLNANMQQLIEKQQQEVLSRVEGIIRERNNKFKFDKARSLLDVSKDKSLVGLKVELRDYSRDASRNWVRIVNTEVSNAVSLGSVDRIVDDNKNVDLKDVLVYRIVVNDSALCTFCRKFYRDKDGSPKLYRMNDLLANGSNFGKKRADWLPTAMATHPSERCSQVIELKPGWKLLSGGTTTYIGPEKWPGYIESKLEK